MKKNKKATTRQFWLVVTGLLLLIGLVTGGAWLIEANDLVSVDGGRTDGPPADMAELAADGERAEPPERGEEGSSSGAWLGLAQPLLQMGLVLLIVLGGSGLNGWWQRWRLKRRSQPATLMGYSSGPNNSSTSAP